MRKQKKPIATNASSALTTKTRDIVTPKSSSNKGNGVMVSSETGMACIRLLVEGEAVILSPSAKQLFQALDRMTPRDWPANLILEADHGYLHVTGGERRFTVEWHEALGNSFRHWVAGRPPPSRKRITIPAGELDMTVEENECLGPREVKILLLAFVGGATRPEQFSWREITEGFPCYP